MKTDLMLVPSDTLVLADVLDVAGGWEASEPVPPGPGVFLQAVRNLYLSAQCSEGSKAYDKGCASCPKHGKCDGEAVAGARDADPEQIGLKIGAPLLAREMGGRIEPLHPAPDDIVLDEKHKDFIFAQPSYLEPLRGDFVRHDRPGLRLLTPTSRKAGAEGLGAFLTRKGVRVWAERKVERFTEGEHYVIAKRLYEIEPRTEPGDDGIVRTSLHLRLRPGVGFVLTVEIPDGRAALSVPATVTIGKGLRTAWVEEVQIPLADIKLKPGRRWRLCALSSMEGAASGLPTWIDAKEWTTLPPYPPGGKLFAIASRTPTRVSPGIGASVPGRVIIPAGATFFIEFNDPVRVDPSTWILAGGY
ncbi:MAG: hypothetical protein HY898_00935 [Deltaproteobacteria bacterium]|nr:hypothetical protein [Deltaproteobacteria bacterium]